MGGEAARRRSIPRNGRAFATVAGAAVLSSLRKRILASSITRMLPVGSSTQKPAVVATTRGAAAGSGIASSSRRTSRRRFPGCRRPVPIGCVPKAARSLGGIRSSQVRPRRSMWRGFPSVAASRHPKAKSKSPTILVISSNGRKKCRAGQKPPQKLRRSGDASGLSLRSRLIL